MHSSGICSALEDLDGDLPALCSLVSMKKCHAVFGDYDPSFRRRGRGVSEVNTGQRRARSCHVTLLGIAYASFKPLSVHKRCCTLVTKLKCKERFRLVKINVKATLTALPVLHISNSARPNI